MKYDPEEIRKQQTSARWSAAARTKLDLNVAEIVRTWDRDLLREPRVLVPADVQALVVGPGGGIETLALPGPLTPGIPDEAAAVDGPEPFAQLDKRSPGVHLHWAMPDALLKGTLRDPRTTPGGGLGLAALPDRWAVIRLLAPDTDDANVTVHVRGWLLDAATGTVRDLQAGAGGPALPGTGTARAVAPAELTGIAGGSLTWTASYDASFTRFAWHDPLDDLAADKELEGALPGGPAGGAATYVVVGWWSEPDLDPLDGVRTEGGLAERSAQLGWRLVDGGGTEHLEREGKTKRIEGLGIPLATRFVSDAGAGAGAFAHEARAVVKGDRVGVEASTLIHGAVVGVPVDGRDPTVDLRPHPEGVRVALGEHTDDLVAALLAKRLTADEDERRAVERLVAAFTGRLLDRLGRPDGLADIDEHEHARAFESRDSGEPPLVDRVAVRSDQVPARPPRPRASTGKRGGVVFTPDKITGAFGLLAEESSEKTIARVEALKASAVGKIATGRTITTATTPGTARGAETADTQAAKPVTPGAKPPDERQVSHPAPPYHVPLDPVLAVSGAARSLRHGGDGRGKADGRLRCRRPSQVAQRYDGMLLGANLLPSLGSGAVPEETLALAREALLLSPQLARWLGRRASARAGGPKIEASTARIAAELALRFDATGAYTAAAGPKVVGGGGTPSSGGFSPLGDRAAVSGLVHEALRRHSLLDGVEPDVVAITAWAQPWVPMWVEFELAVDVAADAAGWALGPTDLVPAGEGSVPVPAASRTIAGRTPLTTAPGDALAAAIHRWMIEETARDAHDQGELDDEAQRRLGDLAGAADALDLAGASLSGVQEALLGLPATILKRRATEDGPALPHAPERLPDLLAAGELSLLRARLIDAFGRTLDLEAERAAVPARRALPGRPATMLHPPRFSAPARVRLRLVDATALQPAGAVDARVDEIEPAQQVSPVAGFLLPDHVDESAEVFAADGTPLGELLVQATGGGVVWEAAPGRPLPADAPPGAALAAPQRPLGWLAAGLVAADAAARDGRPAGEPGGPRESALSALLRAIDTTLWTCDPLAGAGTAALGGIVGRPLAVVRAVLALDVEDDLDELDLDAAGREARAAAYRELAGVEIPVRLGEVTRADDGLLGWFADDDYGAVHVVDRAVRTEARESGRRRGHLGEWGKTPRVPEPQEIDHPYVSADDVILLRPGVPRIVTLLMLPGLGVHVTSGVAPRSQVRLARAFFGPVLDRLVPSIRVGPVLVDPGEVRLPPVAALGERQVLTYRDGPLSWRDDAILAATQSALLPDRTAVLREGWIRVDPRPEEPQA